MANFLLFVIFGSVAILMSYTSLNYELTTTTVTLDRDCLKFQLNCWQPVWFGHDGNFVTWTIKSTGVTAVVGVHTVYCSVL